MKPRASRRRMRAPGALTAALLSLGLIGCGERTPARIVFDAVADFGIAKALSSARQQEMGEALTPLGMSLRQVLYSGCFRAPANER